jgi:hypothetical protein
VKESLKKMITTLTWNNLSESEKETEFKNTKNQYIEELLEGEIYENSIFFNAFNSAKKKVEELSTPWFLCSFLLHEKIGDKLVNDIINDKVNEICRNTIYIKSTDTRCKVI